jgi:flagellar biosynthesis/type III secretory pathway M-ring protein FliF/YscJ
MPVSESAPSSAALEKLSNTVTSAAAEAASVQAERDAAVVSAETRNPSSRDTLESTVENDPAAAAAIISKWLKNA